MPLFSHDCSLDFGPSSRAKISGRDELIEFFEGRLHVFRATSHMISNIEVEASIGLRQARVKSVIHAWHRFVDPTREDAMMWGEYRDVVTDVGGQHLIVSRTLLVAGETGLGGAWHPLPRGLS